MDLTSSSSLCFYIKIVPNTNDDWATNSPFSSALGVGDTGFALSNIVLEHISFDCTRIANTLLSVGDIDTKVDLFGDVKGFGGVANTSDFVFSVENLTGTVIPSRLFGRVVKVVICNQSSLYADDNVASDTIFTGRIFDAKASFSTIEFTCRGKFQLWNKEIGTLTEFDNEVYKSKIYPINYGDLSDAYAFIPAVLESKTSTKVFFDSDSIKEISTLSFWGKEELQEYTADLSDAIINSDNSYLEFIKAIEDVYLTDDLDWDENVMYIWNPPIIVFQITGTPTTMDEHSSSSTGSIYSDASSNRFEFLYEQEGFYVFSCYTAPSTTSGTLTKVSGSGDATLSFTWHSPKRDPVYLVFENVEEGTNFTTMSSAKATPCIVKIVDEYIQIGGFVEQISSNMYSKTKCYVDRGMYSTGPDDYSALATLKKRDVAPNSFKWLVKHTFWCTGYSGGGWVRADVSPGYYNYSFSAEVSKSNFRLFTNTPGYVWNGTLNKYVPNYSSVSGISFLVPGSQSVEGLFTVDLVFPKVSISGEIINMYVLGLFSAGGVFSSSSCINTAAILIGKGGHVIPRFAQSYDLDETNGNSFNNAVGGGVFDIMPGGMKKYLLPDSQVQFLAMSQYSETYSASLSFDHIFDNVTGYANVSELAYPLSNLHQEDGIWDIRVGNTQDLNTNRYFLGFLIDRNDTVLTSGDETFYYYAQKVGFLVHFYVDPFKEQVWGRGEGRIVQDSTYSDRGIVLDKDLTAPPASPTSGDKYIVGANATGGWVGWDNEIALWNGTSWQASEPSAGWTVLVDDEDLYYRFNGTSWVVRGAKGNLTENPVDIIQNLAVQEMGLTLTDLDSTTFDSVHSSRTSWDLAFSIYGNPIKSKDILQKVCEQSGVVLHELGNGTLAVHALDIPASLSGLNELTDAMILTDSNHNARYSEDYTSIDSLITGLKARYQKRYPDNEFMSIRDAADVVGLSDYMTAAGNIIDEDREFTIDLDCIRSQTSVDSVLTKICTYRCQIRRIVSVYTTLATYSWQLGTFIKTSGSSSKIRNSNGNAYLIIGKNTQLSNRDTPPEVKLTLLEIEGI